MDHDPDITPVPSLAKIFDPYHNDARAAYDSRIIRDTDLPAPDGSSTVAAILAWKDIVDEVFLIKVKRHLPFPEPHDLEERRGAVIRRLESSGFAANEREANKLYKNLARHAHVALEALHDSDREAGLKRPYELEIARDGSQRLRGAKGRWRSAKTPAELEMREQLGDMKMAWTERLKDPMGEPLLKRLYELEMLNWKKLTTAVEEVEAAVEDSGYSKQELLASVDVMLAEHYRLPTLHAWPTHDRNRRADIAGYIDSNDLREPLIFHALLDRVITEMQPLVWEYAEQQRIKGPHAMMQHELYERFEKELATTIKRVDGIAGYELNEGAFNDFHYDVEGLFNVAIETVAEYAELSVQRNESPRR